MKIAYFYDDKISDDEEAIKKALELEGHQVDLFHCGTTRTITKDRGYDLLLSHHTYKSKKISKHQIPIKVMWGFDLMVDPTGYLK